MVLVLMVVVVELLIEEARDRLGDRLESVNILQPEDACPSMIRRLNSLFLPLFLELLLDPPCEDLLDPPLEASLDSPCEDLLDPLFESFLESPCEDLLDPLLESSLESPCDQLLDPLLELFLDDFSLSCDLSSLFPPFILELS